MKSWEKIRFGPLTSHIPNSKGAAGFSCICDHKQTRNQSRRILPHAAWKEGKVIFSSEVKTLQSQGQEQLPVWRTHKSRKRNLTAESFVFLVSLLFTADTHQGIMEMFWLYGWEALILSIFIYSLGEKETHKKNPSSLWALLETVTTSKTWYVLRAMLHLFTGSACAFSEFIGPFF